MSKEVTSHSNSQDVGAGAYVVSRFKGLGTVLAGAVLGWGGGYLLNKVTPNSQGIAMKIVEKFGGPFKRQLRSFGENDMIMYETLGSVAGGAGATIYRGYGGWRRDRENQSDIQEIKAKVTDNHGKLHAPSPQVKSVQHQAPGSKDQSESVTLS